LHLRIPFSLYLMPVFCFAVSSYPLPDIPELFLAFIIIHIFLYPASNGFNSYYDKDKGSIGGLEHPPEVDNSLLYTSLVFDAIAIMGGAFINLQFAGMLFIYGLVSKAYSHPAIRLKKYGIISLLTAAIFQGGFTYLMTLSAFQDLNILHLLANNLLPFMLSSLMIMAIYPLTQVYQHEEDLSRGDHTISLMLGIRGTFYFSALVFISAVIGFYFYFTGEGGLPWFLIFKGFLLPALFYFATWFYRVYYNAAEANYKSAMLMNKIASISLILFFIARAVYKG
jgi:4-hydroxybenzoate polyprenyltransferase